LHLVPYTGLQVRAASERFLAALESRWEESRGLLLPGVQDILLHHARSQPGLQLCNQSLSRPRWLSGL
jgi:hypothetical protein